jgi:4-hydroxythreonine-4-phosphate dehydrogenase
MLRSKDKVIVVTMGAPDGVGPEIIRKALTSCVKRPNAVDIAKKYHSRFIVIGNKKVLGRVGPSVTVVDVPYRSAGEGALKFLDKAIAMIKAGAADALVTAPLSKEAVSRFSRDFVGHTEYLAHAFKSKNFDMMFVAPGVRLTIVTRHVPLKDVPRLITRKAVFDSIALMAKTLTNDFKIKNPKIAVLGLNPHAGEAGLLGHEDIKCILPAVRKAQAQGIMVKGPFAADTFFAYRRGYDGVIAMYHDQGLAPLKGMYMKELVNFTAGLPFVRTSPAHGTAFDIAGRNKADPSSMLAALKLACELV